MKKQFNDEDDERPDRLFDIFNDALDEAKIPDDRKIILLSVVGVGVLLFIFAPALRLYVGLLVMGVLIYFIIRLLRSIDWAMRSIQESAEEYRNRQANLEDELRNTEKKHLQPLQVAYQELESRYNTLEIEHKKLQEEFEKYRSRIGGGEKGE